MIIANAFSIQMLPEMGAEVSFKAVSVEMAKAAISSGFVSAIGHADTAAVVSADLGVDVPSNRASIKLVQGDSLLVAQLVGGRLPEGATRLPDGFAIKYFMVDVMEDCESYEPIECDDGFCEVP